MSFKNISLSSRNLIDEAESVEHKTSEPELRPSNVSGKFCESMDHPGDWGGVLTISVDDEIVNRIQPNNERKINIIIPFCLKHLLLICCFILSFSFILASLFVLKKYPHRISKTGGIACLLSFKLAFHPRLPLAMKTRKTRLMKSVVRKYLLKHIFDVSFLKQYVRRIGSVEQTDEQQLLVAFLSSPIFKDWIDHKFKVIRESPEGVILDSLGINDSELEEYFNAFTADLLTGFQKMYLNNNTVRTSTQSMEYHHRLRKYVENITLEKFSNMATDVDFQIMVENIVNLYLENMVCFVMAFMASVGLLAGLIQIYS